MTTLNEMIAIHNELAAKVGAPARKGFDNKAKAEAAINVLKAKVAAQEAEAAAQQAAQQVEAVVAAARPRRLRGEIKIHERGPRGFKFGPVWIASVIAGHGVALMRQNLPKLQDHARTVGVQVTPDLNQAEIAAMVAKAVA